MRCTERTNSTSGFVRATLDVHEQLGFSQVTSCEFGIVSRMIGDLMHAETAAAGVLASASAMQASACMAYREHGEIVGVVGYLFLNAGGLSQVITGRFDGADLDLDYLSDTQEAPAAGYTWGLAVTRRRGRCASVAAFRAMDELRSGAWRWLPFFTRAVTPVGRFVAVTRAGFQPLRGPNDNLLICPAALELAA